MARGNIMVSDATPDFQEGRRDLGKLSKAASRSSLTDKDRNVPKDREPEVDKIMRTHDCLSKSI